MPTKPSASATQSLSPKVARTDPAKLADRLVAIMDAHGLAEIEYEQGGARLRLKRFEGATEARPAAEPTAGESRHRELRDQTPASDQRIITSPFVGRFYRKPTPDSVPFVEAGDHVEKGMTLCIIEAMKLMNEIDSELRCRIIEVLATDGQIVEFGTPLFKVRIA